MQFLQKQHTSYTTTNVYRYIYIYIIYHHVPSGPQKEITSSNHQLSGSIILNKPKLKNWIFPARLLIQMIRQVPLRSACGPGPKFFEMQVRVFMSRPPWRKTHRERKKGSKVSKYQSYLNIKDIQNVLVNVMNASSPIRTFFIHISSKLCG